MSKNKLTKREIVENIHEKINIGRVQLDEVDSIDDIKDVNGSRLVEEIDDVHIIVDEVFNELKKALMEDKVIELRGFGTFEIRTRKGREKARNPKTGEQTSVETHGVAIFRPGKDLKKSAWSLRNE